MQFTFRHKVPIVLMTGFLGSGKTSLLKQVLTRYSTNRRIAVVQNEFAQSSIDGDILRQVQGEFVMHELNTGSIFCVCLFSQFKNLLSELAQRDDIDLVIVEATGIADPIAIAQLVEDPKVSENYYFSNILSVVDAPRFLPMLVKISGVRHQVQVADSVIVNKRDLVDEQTLTEVVAEVKRINPLAHVVLSSYGEGFELETVVDRTHRSAIADREIVGELTKCGAGGYISRSYKSTKRVSREALDRFLGSLTDEVLRVKGYVTLDCGESVMVQYVPGQVEVVPVERVMGQMELISIGFEEPDFTLLE